MVNAKADRKRMREKNAVAHDSAHVAEHRRKSIAAFFKQRRQSAGLSLAQVATALGYEQAKTIEAYESGEVAIPLEDIFSLTNALNIPPEEVLGLVHDLYSGQL